MPYNRQKVLLTPALRFSYICLSTARQLGAAGVFPPFIHFYRYAV